MRLGSRTRSLFIANRIFYIKMETETIHPRVFKVIDSCVTIEQLRTASNLARCYQSGQIKCKIWDYVKLRCIYEQGKLLSEKANILVSTF